MATPRGVLRSQVRMYQPARDGWIEIEGAAPVEDWYGSRDHSGVRPGTGGYDPVTGPRQARAEFLRPSFFNTHAGPSHVTQGRRFPAFGGHRAVAGRIRTSPVAITRAGSPARGMAHRHRQQVRRRHSPWSPRGASLRVGARWWRRPGCSRDRVRHGCHDGRPRHLPRSLEDRCSTCRRRRGDGCRTVALPLHRE